MTTLIDKEINSVCNIKIKGLGDPGPFSFVLVEGQLPTGVTFNQDTYTLEGIFEEEGSFSFRLKGYKKERIENEEDFTINVSNFNIVTFDFKSTLSTDGISWTNLNNSAPPVKVTDDDSLFDGECYYFKDSAVNYKLPFALLDSDFEIHMVFKPMDNLANEAWGSYISFVVNGLNVTLLESGNPLNLIVDFGYFSNWSRGYTGKENEYLVKDEWNEIFFIKRNSVFKFFINGKLVAYNFANTNITPNDLYIGGRYDNRCRTTARWKYLNISKARIEHWKKPPAIKNVIKARFLNENLLFVDDTAYTDIDLKISQNLEFKAIASVEVPLPQGLSIRDNSIVGRVASFERPISSIIRLQIENVDHRSMTFTFLNKIKPNFLLNLPADKTVGSYDIVSDEGHVFNNGSSINKTVIDNKNLLNNISLFVKSYIGYTFTNDLTKEDLSVSFWVRRAEEPEKLEDSFLLSLYSDSSRFIIIDDKFNFRNLQGLIKKNYNEVKLGTDFKHLLLSRKGSIYKLFVDGFLVNVMDFVKDDLKTIGIGRYSSALASNEGYNIFDLKVSFFTVEHWEDYIPENKVLRDIIYTGSEYYLMSTDINEKILIDYPWDNYELVLRRDESYIPPGITVDNDLHVTGNCNLNTEMILKIDLYINSVFNNTREITVKFRTLQEIKNTYLTHSVYIDSINNNYVLQKIGKGIRDYFISPTFIQGLPYFDFNNNLTSLDQKNSYIHIANQDINLRKPFCIELDFLLNRFQGTGGVNQREPFDNVLFSKSGTSVNTEEFFYINQTGELCFRSGNLNTDSQSFNTGLFTQINKHHSLKIFFNGVKLFIKLDNQSIYTREWIGWSFKATGTFYLGRSEYSSSLAAYNLFFCGLMSKFNVYQGYSIYESMVFDNEQNHPILNYIPLIPPGLFYKERIPGSFGCNVRLVNGRLPTNIVVDNEGFITGITNENAGIFNCDFLLTRPSGEEYSVNIDVQVGKTLFNIDPSIFIPGDFRDTTGKTIIAVNDAQPSIGNGDNDEVKYFLPFSRNGSLFYIDGGQLPCLDNNDFEFNFLLTLTESFSVEKTIFCLPNRFYNSHVLKLTVTRGLNQNINNTTNTIVGEVFNSTKNILLFQISDNGLDYQTIRVVGLELFKNYKIKIIRVKNTISIFVDDVLMESQAIPENYSLLQTGASFILGSSTVHETETGFSGFFTDFSLITTKAANNYLQDDYVLTEEKDQHWDSVVLYLDFEHYINETILLDICSKPNKVSIVGNAHLTDVTKKFGNKSLYLDGTGDFLTIPANDNFLFLNKDFTIEFFINTLNNLGTFAIIDNWNGTSSWQVMIVDNKISWWVDQLGYRFYSNYVLSSNTWYHIAITRNNGTMYLFIDGILDTTISDTVNYNNKVNLNIGAQVNRRNGKYDFNGYIDEIRITNGVARYTENFTPITTKFPNNGLREKIDYNNSDPHWKKVYSYLPLTTDFKEYKNAVWSLTGTPTIFGESAKLNNYNNLRTKVNIKNINFTIEFFIRLDGSTEETSESPIFELGLSNNLENIKLRYDTGELLKCSIPSNNNIRLIGSEGRKYKRTHIAIVLDNQSLFIFVNGVKNVLPLVTFNSNLHNISLGRFTSFYSSENFVLIDNFRLTLDVVRYKDNFTPPENLDTTDYISYKDVVLGYEPFLYIPMDDTTGSNPVDLASNATINLVNTTATTYAYDQEPLAPGLGRSMGFNITSNGIARLEVPHEQFGTKLNNLTNSGRSFTIMGWHKRTSSTTFNIVMAGYTDPFGGYSGFRLYGNSFESRDNSNRLPVAIELNVPTFFCVIRDKDKGIYRSFVNGTWTDGPAYKDSQTMSFGYPLQIPGNANWNYYGSNGYYSDFAFFDKALSAEDVERIYNTALNPKSAKKKIGTHYLNM